MATTRQSNTEDGSLGRDVLYALRYYLGGRRGYLILAAVAIAAAVLRSIGVGWPPQV
ncbi:hypothetical protein OEG86_00405 [Hoeflea alexandrii]|uniref:hypothetical protein n=1 Tax=Hoeflea alexandrii TaxID=288436 RepID=UPI002271D475|nr:hypothetical protein [Hoeflea alexandrii]MCY0150991.1 hypothetical protein [Hoeflea alexandrii]